jgi:hypothetical protein
MDLFAKLKSEFNIKQSWTFIEDGKPAKKPLLAQVFR